MIAVRGHSSPGIGFLLKANPRSSITHFKPPDSFDLVFRGDKLGLSKPVICVWALKCPPKYVPVGMVAKKDCQEPVLGDAYCVLAIYTEKIEKWDTIWSKDLIDQGLVKQARPTANEFDILAMGAVMNFSFKTALKMQKNNPLDIYAIKRSEGFFWTEKPILRKGKAKNKKKVLKYFFSKDQNFWYLIGPTFALRPHTSVLKEK